MSDAPIILTAEERAFILNWLENQLGETRAEVRHTWTAEFREKVKHEEELIRGLIKRFREPALV